MKREKLPLNREFAAKDVDARWLGESRGQLPQEWLWRPCRGRETVVK